jgi:DNA repair exonuclease SbcCD ATPase subunit
VDLESVADELYGLRPQDFTAARDARAAEARRAGDRALAGKIGKLRRPSLAAWASNLLVRERPEDIEPLLRVGEGLRQAHRDLDGAQLRELSRQQHLVINALSRQARQLTAQAGHPVGEDVQREVEGILHAVLADPDAAREWAAGHLVKAFDQTVGFPAAADVARPRPARPARAAPARKEARPSDKRRQKADEERRRRLEQARRDAEEAERVLDARREEAAAADRQADDAQAAVRTVEQRISELSEELANLEEQRRQAETTAGKARDQAADADRRLRDARRKAETAVAQVTRLDARADARRTTSRK